MTVDQVIARWQADEATVRARLRQPDTAPQEQIAGRRNGFCVRMAWEPSGVPTR